MDKYMIMSHQISATINIQIIASVITASALYLQYVDIH